MKKFSKLVLSAALLGSLAVGALHVSGSSVEAAEWTPRTVEQIKKDLEGKNEYTIVFGDTLSTISEAWGKNIDDLARLNNISDKNVIFAGNKLYAENGMIQAKDNIGNVIAQTPDTTYKAAPTTNNQAVAPTAPATTQAQPAYVAPAEQPAATPSQNGEQTTPTTPNGGGETTTPDNSNNNGGGTTTPGGNNGGGTTNPTPTPTPDPDPTPTPEPVAKFTVWYTAASAENASHNIAKGSQVFDTEAEATAFIDSYADGLLAQGIASSTYGVSSWVV